ncbi:MAG: hypothetical protein J7K01_06640, partial [Thermovirga sp.]|nr:hypothetical protein [Thermovirga sp.]
MKKPLTSIREVLLRSDCWVILAHEKPDGDTLGCGSALVRRAKMLNKNVIWCGPDKAPDIYKFLFGIEYYKDLK